MALFRKKPVVIEAVQWTGDNLAEMNSFAAGFVLGTIQEGRPFLVGTLEGPHMASVGDYIIKGIGGEFYPCKPDIFAATYEAA